MAAIPPVCEFDWPAVDATLPGTDGKRHSIFGSAGPNGLVVAFICNHCPYVRAVISRIVRDAEELKEHGIGFVAINSNDVVKHPDDSPAKMKEEAKAAGYTFPYLFDESQEVAREYRAACTPDFFVFDGNRRLAYRGQLDDSRPGNNVPVTGKDLRAALDAVIAGKPVPGNQKPSIGCNIKWKPGNEPAQ